VRRDGQWAGNRPLAVFFFGGAEMRVTSSGRVYRSRSEWQSIAERFAASGQTQAEFCVAESIPTTSLQKWLRKQNSKAAGAKFVEIASTVEPYAGDVELRFPNGLILQVRC
jgi:hypothetical protein